MMIQSCMEQFGTVIINRTHLNSLFRLLFFVKFYEVRINVHFTGHDLFLTVMQLLTITRQFCWNWCLRKRAMSFVDVVLTVFDASTAVIVSSASAAVPWTCIPPPLLSIRSLHCLLLKTALYPQLRTWQMVLTRATIKNKKCSQVRDSTRTVRVLSNCQLIVKVEPFQEAIDLMWT